MLEYNSEQRFIVMGKGSKYGRHDDLLTDWRELDGENIALLLYQEEDATPYRHFFVEADVVPFRVQQGELFLLRGRGFRYETYRREVLTLLRDRYYRYPAFLPAGQCYFYQRYFPGKGVARLQQ
jgi:hypothetical protein